ncbi:nucleotidyltransferase family protein [Paenibacillus sp. HN-1]|uniref:tRNA(Met) cytidine acetate ligase n=1 Tax=Paenibacillus TaxID=44249 RepID=UPI001CA9D7A1|nr:MULTISPECIES: nucleotidyltransferase family protein [Paenibacillus]MBY9078445.1 nucleotidyltransferase family protein [Paenibacillus sp. CGMCC 1.18879]MBY9082738.1 nucleotidyltransferase family protein [Paenibacillus sinensis]
MPTVGIIAEYNPLHNGHVHHFREAKRLSGADRAVVVMSGPFTQRGEPALISKRARTEMALRMGADLVLELPVGYALQPAEWFAYGSAALLEASGVVDSLIFGSEAGSLSELLPLSRLLADESSLLQGELRRRLALGEPFPAAYSAAAALAFRREDEGAPETDAASPGLSGEAAESLLRGPNNSLGLHYLIALRRLGSGIQPLTVPRLGAGFHDPAAPGTTIASATAIRGLLQEGSSPADYMPDYALAILRREREAGRGPLDWDSFRGTLLHLLLTTSPEELSLLQGVDEGLEYRLAKVLAGLEVFSVGGLLAGLKSKRYTYTRLQRMLAHILLGHRKEEYAPDKLAQGPGYIRVLGFRSSGRELLKQMKRKASLPVVTSPSRLQHPQLSRDIQAASAYAAAFASPVRRDLYADYLQPPVMI